MALTKETTKKQMVGALRLREMTFLCRPGPRCRMFWSVRKGNRRLPRRPAGLLLDSSFSLALVFFFFFFLVWCVCVCVLCSFFVLVAVSFNPGKKQGGNTTLFWAGGTTQKGESPSDKLSTTTWQQHKVQRTEPKNTGQHGNLRKIEPKTQKFCKWFPIYFGNSSPNQQRKQCACHC